MGPNQIYKLLHNKGNYKQSSKREPMDWEEIFANNECNQQGLYFQNIRTANVTQPQRNKQPNPKHG